MENNKKSHPEWVIRHRKPGTEIKLIQGRYYVYGVKSKYDKAAKKSRKISLGILGSITQKDGFIPSDKNSLKQRAARTYENKKAFCVEYGYAKWLIDVLEKEGSLSRLKTLFPDMWQFIIAIVYCRTAYQSPLKNIQFHLKHSDIGFQLGWEEALSDQKLSDYLFDLGSRKEAIHQYMQAGQTERKSVLVDATDIVCYSQKMPIAQKGYNSQMDFNPQFVLLYIYDAQTLQPLYYRLLPGNIREVSALSNTIVASGIKQCIFIADKGFYSEKNIADLEKAGLHYIIPLKRDNKLIAYGQLADIEQSDNYFSYAKRHVFHTEPITANNRTIYLYLDGMLKEQEKNDYLSRIETLPEYYSKQNFKVKVRTMGTMAIMHNTQASAKEIYIEYKQRGDVEQFFDQLKNTLDASCSYMQREESLNGWMFVNHLSMSVIYKLYLILKTTALSKKKMLSHKYSIMDTITHLKTIQKINFSEKEFIITEIDKTTKTLLKTMKISIT